MTDTNHEILEFGQKEQEWEVVVPWITAILYNPNTGLFGCIHDTKNPWDYWLICWWKNGNEDPIICAKREVQEETWYYDFTSIEPIVDVLYSRYYHPKKKNHFRWIVNPYLIIMKSLKTRETWLEEHEIWFEPIRTTVQAIKDSLNTTWAKRFGEWCYDHHLFLLDKVKEMVEKY